MIEDSVKVSEKKGYKKLKVWEKAHYLAIEIYKITKKFPREELYGITSHSTDWDLYVLQNDNGYAVNDANIPKIQVMEAGNGNAEIYLDLPYQDEDVSNEVHLYYLDNSNANTADIYVIGYEMI